MSQNAIYQVTEDEMGKMSDTVSDIFIKLYYLFQNNADDISKLYYKDVVVPYKVKYGLDEDDGNDASGDDSNDNYDDNNSAINQCALIIMLDDMNGADFFNIVYDNHIVNNKEITSDVSSDDTNYIEFVKSFTPVVLNRYFIAKILYPYFDRDFRQQNSKILDDQMIRVYFKLKNFPGINDFNRCFTVLRNKGQVKKRKSKKNTIASSTVYWDWDFTKDGNDDDVNDADQCKSTTLMIEKCIIELTFKIKQH